MATDEISTKTIDLSNDGGVIKEIISDGVNEDKPSSGDLVSVHYVGTLLDGTKFDSSRDRGEQFEFTLGKGEVIKAWDLGVASMKKGEVCKLTCQSKYAYGKTGSPPKIPGDATLIFEIELFSFKGEDLSTKKDGGIIRKIIEPGQGHKNPNEAAQVTINIIGKTGGSVFDEREVTFLIGEGCEQNIPEGIEKALEKFLKKEKSRITLLPEYGFGSEGNSTLGVGPNATLEYEIKLDTFEKAKEVWEMDQVHKLEKSKALKIRGTEYFSKQNYKMAIRQYFKITEFLSYDAGLDDDQKVESANTLKAAHLNLSLCHFKLEDFIQARDFASKVLETDDSHVKAYFRRAKALLELKDPEDAKKDLEKAYKLDPKNKAVAQELRSCISLVKEEKLKEEKLYKGMFEKFAKSDTMRNAKNGLSNDVMSGDLGDWETKQAMEEAAKKGELGDEEEAMPDFSTIEDIQMI